MRSYSVIIATHKRAEWLKRAVESVKRQICSVPVRVIVVSDVIDPPTYDVLATLLSTDDLFIQRLGLSGPAESRNVGIQLLSTDYAMFLDDDDEFPPEFVANVDASRPHDDPLILYSDFTIVHQQMVDSILTTTSTQHHSLLGRNNAEIYIKNFIPNSCLVYPTPVLKAHRFDTALRLNEDWDFLLSVMAGCPLSHVPLDGPRIYKNETPRRGNSNDQFLIENYIEIYKKWPGPTEQIKTIRQSLLAQNGVVLPLANL